MIEKGTLAPDATAIVWTSEKLPNDPLVVRKSLDPNLVAAVQTLVLAMDDDTARRVMPAHYTGWVKADHGSYKLIQDAGVAVGKLKPKT
jgi:phosphonate transport system substrate-binding protein